MRSAQSLSQYNSSSRRQIRTAKGGEQALDCMAKYLLCCFFIKTKQQPLADTQKAYVPKLRPKAMKVFDINDEQQSQVDRVQFRQVVAPIMPDSGRRMTKTENYGQEDNEGVAVYQMWLRERLDFRLDEQSGVSNTFAVPFFNYNLLQRNRYASKSTVSGSTTDE